MAHRDSGAWCDIEHVTTIWYVISTWIFYSHYILYGNSKSASLSARYRSSSSDMSQLMPQRTQGPVSPLFFPQNSSDLCKQKRKRYLCNDPTSLILPYCYSILQSSTSKLSPHLPPLVMRFLLLHPDAESHSRGTPRPNTRYLWRDKILNSKQKTIKRTVYGHHCWNKPKTRPSHVACTL